VCIYNRVVLPPPHSRGRDPLRIGPEVLEPKKAERPGPRPDQGTSRRVRSGSTDHLLGTPIPFALALRPKQTYIIFMTTYTKLKDGSWGFEFRAPRLATTHLASMMRIADFGLLADTQHNLCRPTERC
jgi:hypothetical protein